MRPSIRRAGTLRAAVVALTAGLALTACGSSGGGSGSSGTSGSGAKAATATSAQALGGMDALVKAAKAEGTLNVIALPPDWANYGEMLKAFGDKYGIKINSANPDGSSADEIAAVTSQKGQDRAPDVLDVGGPSPCRPPRRACSRPTRWPTWDDIPENQKDPNGRLVQRLRRLHLDRLRRQEGQGLPDHLQADLLDPQYKGQVALNGNPTKAGAAFSGVWAASLANGGSLDDIGPGIDFFGKLKKAGNFNPVEVTPATVESGETPIRSTGTTSTPPRQRVAAGGRRPGRSTCPRTASSAASTPRPSASSRRTRPRPGSGRSSSTATEGQNIWLKGSPVRSGCPAMQKAGTADARRRKQLPQVQGKRRVPDAGPDEGRAEGRRRPAGTRRCPAEYSLR